jgi:hypothetical protein
LSGCSEGKMEKNKGELLRELVAKGRDKRFIDVRNFI